MASRCIIVIALTILVFSCHHIKQDTKKVIAKAKDKAEAGKEKILEKKDELADKILPSFDAGTPDTKANKKRFKEFLETSPTPDVKNIYCLNDEIGIDADYEFAFECNEATINTIIQNLHLKPNGDNNMAGIDFGPDLPWWDKTEINALTPWWKKGEHETYWYLWYNKVNHHAYFITFDI